MKLNEITNIIPLDAFEWNTGEQHQDEKLSMQGLTSDDIVMPFTTEKSNGKFATLYWDKSIKPMNRFILVDKQTPIGILITNTLNGNHQILSTYVDKQWRGLGYIENLIKVLQHNLGLTIVSGDQMSPAFISVWDKLSHLPEMRIYDGKLDKFYRLTDIGGRTSDGVEIIHPSKSKSNPLDGDYHPRFHLALLGKGQISEEHLRTWNKLQNESRAWKNNTTLLESLMGSVSDDAGVITVPLWN